MFSFLFPVYVGSEAFCGSLNAKKSKMKMDAQNRTSWFLNSVECMKGPSVGVGFALRVIFPRFPEQILCENMLLFLGLCNGVLCRIGIRRATRVSQIMWRLQSVFRHQSWSGCEPGVFFGFCT